MIQPTAEAVSRQHHGTQQNDGFYLCRCPVPSHGRGRGDKNPSLSVKDGDDGWLVVNCHAGCSRKDVFRALGYEPPKNGTHYKSAGSGFNFNSAPKQRGLGKVNGLSNQPPAPKPFSDQHLLQRGYRHIADYDYTTPDGEVLYQVRRYEHPTERKTFLQRRPDGNGGWFADAGTRKVLYRWPDVARTPHTTVYVTEGEKDADRLASLDFIATTVASGSWSQEAIQALAGRDCFILEDNDNAGRKKAAQAASEFNRVAASVRIVKLPGLREGGDVTDWLDAGPDREVWFSDLCQSFPLWTPGNDEADAAGDNDAGQDRDKSLPFEAFDDITIDVNKPWIFKNLIARRETSSWIGGPGMGKSALLTDIAIHSAVGRDWRGYRLKERCASVIFAFERADLLKRRLEAYRRKHKLKSLPIAVVKTPVNMLSPELVDIFASTIKAVEERFGLPVGLVVIDTYSKAIAFGGGDENSAKDQNRVLGHIREIENQTDVHVALVGHTGKDETKGHRGSNANLGDVDVEVRISGDLVKTALVTKANDQPEGPLTTFRMETFDFGLDEDGDPITTSVVSDDVLDKSLAKGKPKRLNHGEQVAMKMLREALSEGGIKPPASNHIPGQVRSVVTKDLWRRYCYLNGISAEDATDEARKKAFGRAVKTLQANGLIDVWEPYVWIVGDDAT